MKCGLKTFPLSVDLDDSVKLVEAEFGVKGFAIVIKLYQAIYSRGYYMKWDIDAQLLFIRDYCLSEIGRGLVSEVVDCCIRRGVFEPTLYKEHNILTSKRIQETFLTATKRSIKVVMEEQYALSIVYEFIENASKNGKNANISFKNADSFQQRKGKERKEKKISSSTPISPNLEGSIKTIPIKPTAIAFRRFVEEFKIVVIPNTDLSVFTLETIQSLTDKFRRISWLGDEPHDSKWIAQNAEQIINGIYDYSIDRDYTVCQEVDEHGEVKDIVSYTPIEKVKRRNEKSKAQTKQEQRKEQDDMIFDVLGKVWREGKMERGELIDDE